MMISLSAQVNYVTMAMHFPWDKVRNDDSMRQAGGDVCFEWHRIQGGGGSGVMEKEVKLMHTLLSSGCTPRIYKEEGACLPGQQKE